MFFPLSDRNNIDEVLPANLCRLQKINPMEYREFPAKSSKNKSFKNFEFLTAWLPLQDLNVFLLDAGRPSEVALAVIGPVVAAADGIFRLLVLVTDHPGVAVCNM